MGVGVRHTTEVPSPEKTPCFQSPEGRRDSDPSPPPLSITVVPRVRFWRQEPKLLEYRSESVRGVCETKDRGVGVKGDWVVSNRVPTRRGLGLRFRTTGTPSRVHRVGIRLLILERRRVGLLESGDSRLQGCGSSSDRYTISSSTTRLTFPDPDLEFKPTPWNPLERLRSNR